MKVEVFLNEKPVVVDISQAGLNQLQNSVKPLLVEVELYFSCLIKKVCHFRTSENTDGYTKVAEGLFLGFRATMTRKCAIGEFDQDRSDDFPIVNPLPYIPKWVSIGYSGNQWAGDFGYAAQE